MSKLSKATRHTYSKKNKKVDDDLDENILFSDEDSEIGEENTGVSTNTVDEVGIKQAEIEINHFFNELPIRIVNSHQFPFFYAEDISKILGIKRVKASIANFTEKEIVSPELRKKYNITTYQKYRNTVRRNDKIILLTEFGVYRLLMNSRSQFADQFRDFVYDVLYQLRTAGEYKVKGELEKLKTINEEQQAQIGTLTAEITTLKVKQEQFKNLLDEIVLIEHKNNPYEIQPTNIPKRLLKKSVNHKINPRHNRVDNPIPIAIQLAADLKLPNPLVDIPIDSSTEQLRAVHDQNVIAARAFIDEHAVKHSYMVTTDVAPALLTESTVIHRVYVKDKAAALKSLQLKLADVRPDRVSSRTHWYSCDRQIIIDSMNAIAG